MSLYLLYWYKEYLDAVFRSETRSAYSTEEHVLRVQAERVSVFVLVYW